MSGSNFIAEFQAMHAKARKGELPAAERPAYLAAREQFAQQMLYAQGLTLSGADGRRHYRVAHELEVELQMAYGNVWTRTLDLSSGGFAVALPHPVDTNERPSAMLVLPDGIVLAGRVRGVSQFQRAGQHRASFAFLDLTEREFEMLELLLVDLSLERMNRTSS